MANLPAPPYSYETGKTASSTDWKKGAGNGRVIKGITIHHWGASMSLDFDGIVNFLCSSRPADPTSAHYVAQGKDQHGVKKPRVACIVDPEDIAYHAGNWNGNLTTIGIECRPNGSPEDLEVVAQLIARLRNQYGPLPLYPHSHWTSTECPGNNYRAQLAWLDKRANAILAAGSKPAPAPAPVPAPVPSATVTTLSLNPQVQVINTPSVLSAATSPATATGTHAYQWFNPTTKVWATFASAPVTQGRSSVSRAFGGSHPVRVVFTPASKAFKGSTSPEIEHTGVNLQDVLNRLAALEKK